MIGKVQEKMDGQLREFRTSFPEDKCIIKLQEYCKFSLTLLKIPVVKKPLCIHANCHNNVNQYVSTYGGEKISGYYLITDINNDSFGCAVYHSIWKNTYGELIDITPFEDDRKYNMFSIFNGSNYYSGVVYDGKNCKVLPPGINII